MIIEEQIITIEQAKHLQSLGLDMSDAAIVSYFCVGESGKKDRIVTCLADELHEACYASSDYIYRYTLQEMWSKLPRVIIDKKPYKLKFDNHQCVMYYESILKDKKCLYAYGGPYSLLNCVCETLCFVVENGYLKQKNEIQNSKENNG